MRVKDLLDQWEKSAGGRLTPQHYTVRLPIQHAAKLAALAEMYPRRSEEELITDLLAAALDEIEAAFPYVQGRHVIAEDDQGDPIYEDVGQTPRFANLNRKHLDRLRRETSQ